MVTMRTLWTALLALSIIVASCAPDEPVINSYDDSWRILVAGSSEGLALIGMPNGALVYDDVIRTAADTKASAYGDIQRFRDDVFLLHTAEPTVTILSADSLRLRTTIDFGNAGPASSIAFANATTAFATHPNSDVISVIDLTTYSVASTIAVPGRPISIAIAGNQACIASQSSAEVRLFDTRSFQLSSALAVAPAPTFVIADPTNDAFVVVSLGAGKVDSATASVPTMSFVDIDVRSVAASVALTQRTGQGAERIPMGAALTDEGFVYVAMQDVLLRVPARSRSRATLVQEGSFSALASVPTRAEMLVATTGSPSVNVFDGFVETRRSSANLPFVARTMLALTP
jgi:YVTN family beta-propeller protein